MFNGRSEGASLINNEVIVTCDMASSNAKRLLALRSDILPTTFFETNGRLGVDIGLLSAFDWPSSRASEGVISQGFCREAGPQMFQRG